MAFSQIQSASDKIEAQPIADRILTFDVTDTGITKKVEFGPDLAWANEQNFRRAILFMGLNQVDIVRTSFQPTYPLVNNTDLSQEQLMDIERRIELINTYVGPNTNLALNCDHPSVDSWYIGFPERWEQLIETSTRKYLNAGHKVITVGAFNEPDYGWGQGSAEDMYAITSLLDNNPLFENVRLSGGNTLNCDEALGWYEYLIPAGVNEGNTHQLAGSFDGYAGFFQNVRANGHHATADELHNLVEALVGYEYGMQTGIWWADIDLASGEMVKAFDGQRLGYAEHRANWTAAAVYRSPGGKIQAFGGTSERQAKTTTYSFVSKDRAVYFDGHGPQRVFTLKLPGGTNYQQGQSNAERVVNITYGTDIQPVIDGRYKLVNRKYGQVMEVAGDADGAEVFMSNYSGRTSQQWDVYPVDSKVGGDFSYFRIKPVSSNSRRLDLNNFSLDNEAKIQIWSNGLYGNQQWYLEYQDNGWFYIRSRESTLCVDVNGSGKLWQMEKNGNASQQWRMLPMDAEVEFNAPSAPTNLVARSQSVSVKLNWTSSPEQDVASYTVYRSNTSTGGFNTIARNVTATSYVDNTVRTGTKYFYKIKSMDGSLNSSTSFSNVVSSTVSGDHEMVAELKFDENSLDSSINLNHSAVYGTAKYDSGKEGSKALNLDGSTNFVQLPSDIASHRDITVATWVYWNGGSQGQCIFNFGNSDTETMFLTPNSDSGQLYFGIKKAGGEQGMATNALPTGQWSHVAVTLADSDARMYVNGKLVAQSNSIVLDLQKFNPLLNYIGRGQLSGPLFKGRIDDFKIYNYPLTEQEVRQLALTSDNFNIESVGETCPNKNNGQILIKANADLVYKATVNETSYSFTDRTLSLTNLIPDTYDICIAIEGIDMEQCYSIEIPKSNDIAGTMVSSSNVLEVDIKSGTAPFKVEVNGVVQFETEETKFKVFTNQGDLLEIKSAKPCEGILTKKMTSSVTSNAVPNPTSGEFVIYVPTKENTVTLEIYTIDSKLISKLSYPVLNSNVQLNIGHLPNGVYMTRVLSHPVRVIRIIKI